jgi:capsular polysaccharide export protein
MRAPSSRLLIIPPFPGYRPIENKAGNAPAGVANVTDSIRVGAYQVVAEIRRHKIGGTYWGAQARLEKSPILLIITRDEDRLTEMLTAVDTSTDIFLYRPDDVANPLDPWSLFNHADAVWADGDDPLLLLARMAGLPVRAFGPGRFASLAEADDDSLHVAVTRELIDPAWSDPFTGELCGIMEILRHHAAWRALIDANRTITAAFGFGQWKQQTVDALLWNGRNAHVDFAPATSQRLAEVMGDETIALWKARVPAEFLAECEQRSAPVHEVEDGFIRSVGLGANCVPPLSIIVDAVGVHYDPSRPSGLENLLVDGQFDSDLLARAAELRRLVVESGISKYEVGVVRVERPGGARRHVLVTGQVEDDRSVLTGAGSVAGNLDLLRRARAAEPDAFIIYKPHPDVLSGHRKGHVTETDALRHADIVMTDQPISALLDMVDAIHVMTSLAGFEALLRGKEVITHGVPFYAGWGLTRDLGNVPERRNRKRSLDELVGATLLLYPRYLDPMTGLPCSPEILVKRLKSGVTHQSRVIVLLRRTQGSIRRIATRLGFAA